MDRIIGIDYGYKRIGIALSDPLGYTAQPIKVIESKGLNKDTDEIAALIAASSVTKIVIGLPLNMDGTDGNIMEDVKAFGARLTEKTGIPAEYYDERLSTDMVDKMLTDEADISREKRKKVRDKLSACIILQSYLDSKSL